MQEIENRLYEELKRGINSLSSEYYPLEKLMLISVITRAFAANYS